MTILTNAPTCTRLPLKALAISPIDIEVIVVSVLPLGASCSVYNHGGKGHLAFRDGNLVLGHHGAVLDFLSFSEYGHSSRKLPCAPLCPDCKALGCGNKSQDGEKALARKETFWCSLNTSRSVHA